MSRNSLSNFLEIWGFEEDFTVFGDESIGFGFELGPIDIDYKADSEINSISESLGRLLSGFSSGLDIQVVHDIASGNQNLIEAHRDLITASEKTLASKLANERADYLLEMDKSGALPTHRIYIFVRKRFSKSLGETSKGRKKSFTSVSEERLRSEIEAANLIRESIFSELKSVGLSPEILTAQKTAELSYSLWNPGRDTELGFYNPEDVRPHITLTDVEKTEAGIKFGEHEKRVISLKILPDYTFSCMIKALNGLRFNSRVSVSVRVPDQMKEIESLQTQRRIAYSLVMGTKGVSDLQASAKLNDIEELLEQIISQGEKVLNFSMNIILSSDDKWELEAQVSQTLSLIRELGGAEGLVETYAAFDIFAETAVPNARSREREKRVKSSNVKDLLPVFSPWPGHKIPRMLFRNRFGGLLSVDLFDPSLSNANQLISGASGTGKSFLMNLQQLQMFKEKPKSYFIDIGGSYKKLCENLGGQYVSNIAVNPFDLPKDVQTVPPQKIKFLLGIIEQMTKESSEASLPKLIRSELEQSIQSVYRDFDKPILSNLKERLLKHQDSDLVRIGRVMEIWCGDTVFGQYVDRQTTTNLENDLVVFDLKEFDLYPELQTVFLYTVADLVWREIQKNRETMKFLVFDECWKLLKDEKGLGISFIEESFRTFRKYNASATAISQSVADFANSPIASVLFSNCATKCVLPQKLSDPELLAKLLNLNNTEVATIESLRQEKGLYSEFFLMSGENRSVGVLQPTPLEMWLATTDARDLAKIDDYKKENPDASNIESLKALAQLYPQGVANAS